MIDHPVTGRFVLLAGIVATAVAVAAVLAVIVGAKMLRHLREGREAQVRDVLTERLIEVMTRTDELFAVADTRITVGADTFAIDPPGGVRGRATREVIATFLATIAGAGSSRLIEMLEGAGYVRSTLHMLRSRSVLVRVRGCTILGGMRSRRAVEALTKLFWHDRSPTVRITAAEALGAIGDPASIPLLAEAVWRPHVWPSMRIANVLAVIGPPAVPHLMVLLRSYDDAVVQLALDILIDIGIEGDAKRVRPLLVHRSPEVRARVADLLGRAGAVDALPDLLALALDPAWFVRVRALKALGRIGVSDEAEVAENYFRILSGRLEDESWWVRQHAAQALAGAGERGARILGSSISDAARVALQAHALREGTAARA